MKTLKFYKDNWFLLFLILYSANGISLLNSNIYLSAIIILFALSLFKMSRNNISIIGLGGFILMWTAYCLVNFFYFRDFSPLFFILLPICVFSAYVLTKSYLDSKMIFLVYEKIIYQLAIISLFFYGWQILNISSLISVFSLFDFNIGDSYNGIIYTIHHTAVSGGLNRNSGFCWEPGPFACFLILALVIYFLNNNFRLDKRVVVYTITILSTFSTTGYLCFLMLILWYFSNINIKYSFISYPIAIILSLFLYFNSQYLNSKIFVQVQKAQQNIEFYSVYGQNKMTSIGRFDGFLLNLKDFENYPFFGYGGHFEATFSQKNKLKIASTSGLGNWLAQFGIVGALFLIFYFYKSTNLICYLFNKRGIFYLYAIFLIITFSFNLIYSPLFILFIFFGLFVSKNDLLINE